MKQFPISFTIMKFWVCIIRFFIIFCCCNSATKCYEVAFVLYCCIHYNWQRFCFTRFLSQVDWISEKANIIAVKDKKKGFILCCNFIFLLLQKLNFWRKKNRNFTRGTETEHEIKKTTNFYFLMFSKVIEQEIYLHGYETQTKSFQ